MKWQFLSVFLLLPICATAEEAEDSSGVTVVKAETQEQTPDSQPDAEVKADPKAQADDQNTPALTSIDPDSISFEWQDSRSPFAVYVGDALPDSLQPGGVVHTSLSEQGYQFAHYTKKELPKSLRKISGANNKLHLSHFDSRYTKSLKQEVLSDPKAVTPVVEAVAAKSLKRRLKLLEKEINQKLRTLASPNKEFNDKVAAKQTLSALATNENIKGLSDYVERIVIDTYHKKIEIRARSGSLRNMRQMPVTSGLSGAGSIDLPEMDYRSVSTTVVAP